MRIYISGPMSGYPEHNFPAFIEAAEALDAAGFTPVSPHINGDDDSVSWNDYLRRDLQDLLSCEGVATLPYWQNSRGASLEVYVAQQLAMTVKPAHLWTSDQ